MPNERRTELVSEKTNNWRTMGSVDARGLGRGNQRTQRPTETLGRVSKWTTNKQMSGNIGRTCGSHNLQHWRQPAGKNAVYCKTRGREGEGAEGFHGNYTWLATWSSVYITWCPSVPDSTMNVVPIAKDRDILHFASTGGFNFPVGPILYSAVIRLPFLPNQGSPSENEFNKDVNLSTPKSDQFQISPAASPEILHHTLRRTWLFTAYSDESWLRCQILTSPLI